MCHHETVNTLLHTTTIRSGGVRSRALLAGVLTIGLGYVVVRALAAGPLALVEAEDAAAGAGAQVVTRTGASGGKMVQFGVGVVATATPTPTVAPGTPTPTSSPGARSCPAWPAVPDASCTGVPAGYSLAVVSGNLATTANGQLIDGKQVTGDINIGHNIVTITNSRVKGLINLNGHSGIVIRDVDLGPDACPAASNGGFRAVDGSDGYTLQRVHIHHHPADMLVIGGGSPVVIQDSLLDKTCYYAGDHLDTIQWYDPGAVGHITIVHNNIDVRTVNSSDYGNAAIFWADGAGAGTTLMAYNNRLAGGNVTTALYDAVAGSQTVLNVHDNVYVKNSYTVAPCSYGGSVKSINYDGSSGVIFTNNKYDDGSAVSCS